MGVGDQVTGLGVGAAAARGMKRLVRGVGSTPASDNECYAGRE